ncbi:hypothetical protein AERO8C_50571 [Aeromonas veronii]|uniref:Uncharacterized protein n=1 Tax=Aeromonas veronii TaxID=654 RepID=A0A653LBE4_AERVE|nr:hypothetical protein AERO8C_50571 [Aeromonas veronii]
MSAQGAAGGAVSLPLLPARRVRVCQHAGGHPLRDPAGLPLQHARHFWPLHQCAGDELLPADPAAHLGGQQISSVIQDVSFRSESTAQILRRYAGVRGDRIRHPQGGAGDPARPLRLRQVHLAEGAGRAHPGGWWSGAGGR